MKTAQRSIGSIATASLIGVLASMSIAQAQNLSGCPKTFLFASSASGSGAPVAGQPVYAVGHSDVPGNPFGYDLTPSSVTVSEQLITVDTVNVTIVHTPTSPWVHSASLGVFSAGAYNVAIRATVAGSPSATPCPVLILPLVIAGAAGAASVPAPTGWMAGLLAIFLAVAGVATFRCRNS